jgi:alpha-D-ribose 1-methylphosphonate 5-triphosphate synthase subunit PhnI
MANRFVGRILKLGLLMNSLLSIEARSFVFTRGFRLVAIREERTNSLASICVDRALRKPLASTGVALFLLAFITNEALVMIRALCH